MPRKCPSCSQRNPTNASKCLHCSVTLPRPEDDEEQGASSKNQNLVIMAVVLIAGVFAALMYISEGNPGGVFSGAQPYDRHCLDSGNSSVIGELKSRGYSRCSFPADRKNCTKRGKQMCLEKALEGGEERYRKEPKTLRKLRNVRDLAND
jgi:hypothetical protein